MTHTDISSLAVVANESFRRSTIAEGVLDRGQAAIAGSALIAIEASLVHGEFKPWLHRNFDGTARDARALMNVARSVNRLSDRDPLRGGTLEAYVERLDELRKSKRGAREAYRAAAAQEGFRRAAGKARSE